MKKVKNIKGFTLVELLATITVLSLLTVVVIITVSSLMSKSHQSYYDSEENMIILSAKTYFSDYKSKLPKELGELAEVTLETLINGKYIDPVYDHKKESCYVLDSKVKVQKVSYDDYHYYVTLSCPNYHSRLDDSPPVVSFKPNKKVSYEDLNVIMKVVDNEQVDSYCYVISKDGVLGNSVCGAYEHEVSIPLTDDGVYQITGYGYDTAGNMGTTTSGEYRVQKSGPNCAGITFTSVQTPNQWMTGKATVKITVPEDTYRWTWSTRINNGEYTQEEEYLGNVMIEKEFTLDGKNQGKVTLYDEAGHSCYKETEQYWIINSNPVIEKFTIASTKSTYNDIATNLTIKASNIADLPMEMYISNTGYGQNGSWESYTETKAWNLGGSLDGSTRTVYIMIRDSLGHTAQTTATYKVYQECVSTKQATKTGTCSVSCGGGQRTDTITTTDTITGKTCNTNTKTESCNTTSCCSSTTASYGGWSSCNCSSRTKSRTVTYKSTYNGQTCSTKTETQSCSAGCTSVAIRNANYQVCPSDMNWQSCSPDGRYDTLYITNASVSGTTVSFHWRVHANNYSISCSNRCPGRMICISDTSNNCVYNIHQFSVHCDWISPGGNIQGDVSVNVNNWTKGDYKVIVKEYNCTISNTYSKANRFVDNNSWIIFNVS